MIRVWVRDDEIDRPWREGESLVRDDATLWEVCDAPRTDLRGRPGPIERLLRRACVRHCDACGAASIPEDTLTLIDGGLYEQAIRSVWE